MNSFNHLTWLQTWKTASKMEDASQMEYDRKNGWQSQKWKMTSNMEDNLKNVCSCDLKWHWSMFMLATHYSPLCTCQPNWHLSIFLIYLYVHATQTDSPQCPCHQNRASSISSLHSKWVDKCPQQFRVQFYRTSCKIIIPKTVYRDALSIQTQSK